MRRFRFAWAAAFLGLFTGSTFAALDVTITCWRQNLNGRTGTSTNSAINACVSLIPSDVTSVKYTATDVYVRSTDVPSYNVGPFPDGNPSYPSNRDRSYRIPRSPVAQSGTHTATPLGSIGVLMNGVCVFNALDAHSYNNQNIWHQNAVVVEALGFDSSLGHPAPVMNGGNCNGHQNGLYHHHQRSPALLAALGDDGVRHSPIIGYAYDGFPIYGPYAYDDPISGGAVRRMRSSYRLRNITTRTTLPDGTVLPPSQYGPNVSTTYPLGYYIEDFEYIAGMGDLDQYNGRINITPEYPGGIYCYYATIDSSGGAAYPYYLGPTYYGVVATDNFSTVTVPGNAMQYHPGDVNCDAVLSLGDIDPFVLALIDPTSYAAAFPSCDAVAGDMNGDGVLDSRDIQLFVTTVTGH
ncbi:MAG TPA: YHYH protein [Phycisphaerae bacterium]|nr:YHYH protein [Phycisphaerae bacterium]